MTWWLKRFYRVKMWKLILGVPRHPYLRDVPRAAFGVLISIKNGLLDRLNGRHHKKQKSFMEGLSPMTWRADVAEHSTTQFVRPKRL
jgi:hypothetical protein